MESEYIALNAAGKEAMWLKQLFKDVTGHTIILELFEDNQSTIKSTQNFIHSESILYALLRTLSNSCAASAKPNHRLTCSIPALLNAFHLCSS